MVLFVSGARPLKVFGRTGAMNGRRASDMSECYCCCIGCDAYFTGFDPFLSSHVFVPGPLLLLHANPNRDVV